MTAARWSVVAIAVVMAMSCGPSDDVFRLRILWRDSDQGCPPRTPTAERRCEAIAMTCDAKMRIRVVDAEDPNLPYYTHCFDLPAGGDACKLGELAIVPSEIPNTMVKVQVAVWAAGSLGPDDVAADGCPVTAEFVNGVPKLENPLPALGGEAYFDVGHDRTAEVELGCPNLAALDCPDTSVTVVATLYDLGVVRQTARDVPRLTVKLGVPVDQGDGTYTINQAQLVELTATDGEEPTWRLRLDYRPEGVQCLWVLYQAPQSTAALTCFDTVIDEVRGELRARGFVVKPSDVDNVLKSMDLQLFPDRGMVIGLVVNGVNLQVAGAVVSPTPLSPIHYPSPLFPPVARASTSELGMFVSLEAPFDAWWSAFDETGAVDDASARGGLVAEHVSVVLIRLAPSLIASPSASSRDGGGP
jgi:hypothetical protein